ncbi:HERC2, partial [Symbiodinium natans]
MSISVRVHLLSGKSALLATEPEESVTSLCQRAQCALGAGKGRLLTASGDRLAGGAVKRARLQDN